MFSNSLGEFISLGAVAGWTVSALAFESAGRRIGSVPVNVIRLVMACFLLALINGVRGITPWPPDIARYQVLWLLASGFVGFFLGDLLLFRSYLIIGSRMAMLIMSLSPPLSALLDHLVFGATLVAADGIGILLTMTGVMVAVGLPPKKSGKTPETDSLPPSETPAGPPIRTARWLGLLLAFGGAAGQSGGMILAKLGMANFDPLGATFVRAVGGLGGFIPLVLLTGASGRVVRGLSDGKAMLRMSIGAVAGPVLGVSAVLLAMRYSPAGVVSAITAIVPVTIILPSMIFLKEKVKVREVLGALIAVSGVIFLIFT